MKFLYEELEGLADAGKLSLALAYSIPYWVQLDLTWGTEIITYKPVEVSLN